MTSYALLGGSFDPIHNGHLQIARQVLKAGFISRFIFLPNARHNFKQGSVVLDFEQRMDLVKATLEPGMEAWPDDATGTGYTSDLLRNIYQKYPRDDFYFVIGADNLAELHHWHDFPWLRKNVRFLIIPRPEYPLDNKILNRIRRKTIKVELCNISSSQIRALIAEGKSISGLVPRAVEERIVHLYSSAGSR